MTPESNAGFGSSLLRAVSAGRPRQVRLLIDSGADVNFPDDCEQTPLMRAMFLDNSRTQLKIVKTLLKNGAKVSLVDIVGRTALSWACLRGCDLVLPILLSYADGKLDLNRGDMNGCTALYHAATSGSAKTVKLIVAALQKYKLSVDISNLQGVTPLMQAFRLGNDVCASVLVHQGQASLTVRDENFLNAGDWAEKAGRLSKNSSSKLNTFPIIQESTAQNKARAYRALRRNQRLVAVERELSSDEDSDSVYSSGSSFLSRTTDGGFTSGYDSDLSRMTPEAVSSSFSDQEDSSQLSDDGDIDSVSTPVDQFNKRHPDKSQVKFQNDLPSIYDMYEEQLSKSFRRGYIPKYGRDNTPSPQVFHGEGCTLECCSEKPKSALLRLSDQKIQRVARVTISARSKEERVTSAKRQKGKNQSLRKAIAERRLRETLPNLIEEKVQHRTTDSSVSMATQQNVTSLPAISKKLFLVSGSNSPTDDDL